MVQTGMTTPYTAFAQQNGGPAGDTSAMKPDMKAVDGGPPGGGGGGGSPNATQQALQALHQSAQHANGVVDQQQNATVCDFFFFDFFCEIHFQENFREIDFTKKCDLFMNGSDDGTYRVVHLHLLEITVDKCVCKTCLFPMSRLLKNYNLGFSNFTM